MYKFVKFDISNQEKKSTSFRKIIVFDLSRAKNVIASPQRKSAGM